MALATLLLIITAICPHVQTAQMYLALPFTYA
jgi:hypothetical protein